MADYTLTAQAPLGDYRKTFADTELSEVTNLAIVSLAIPKGGEAAFAEKFSAAYSCQLATAGQSSVSTTNDAKLLWMQQDQYFLLSEYNEFNVIKDVEEKLGDTAYFGDQSDSWVVLRIKGPQSLQALERICPIDIHSEAFPVNAVSRTSMEHMSAVIMKEDENSFLLMSLRSYAHSFLHALETSFENIGA